MFDINRFGDDNLILRTIAYSKAIALTLQIQAPKKNKGPVPRKQKWKQ